jgi:hypothetical protein
MASSSQPLAALNEEVLSPVGRTRSGNRTVAGEIRRNTSAIVQRYVNLCVCCVCCSSIGRILKSHSVRNLVCGLEEREGVSVGVSVGVSGCKSGVSVHLA